MPRTGRSGRLPAEGGSRPATTSHLGRAWSPSGGSKSRSLRVCAFTSPGLDVLASELGFPVAIIGATTDPGGYLDGLRRREHGCWDLRTDWAFDGIGGREDCDPSVPAFAPLPLDPRWMGAGRLPAGVALDSGSLLLALRGDVDDYAERLKATLARRRFEAVAAKAGWVLHRRRTGRPPIVAPRYARLPGSRGREPRFAVADDIFAFRPKDLPALVAATVGVRDGMEARRSAARLLATI